MAPIPTKDPTSRTVNIVGAGDTVPSKKEMVLATKEPSQTPSRAGRPRINTAARAIPAAGKIGEMLPGEIVTRKLTLAATAYRDATTSMADEENFTL
jgi:hypothetical protein